jgi:hypothetical protein
MEFEKPVTLVPAHYLDLEDSPGLVVIAYAINILRIHSGGCYHAVDEFIMPPAPEEVTESEEPE